MKLKKWLIGFAVGIAAVVGSYNLPDRRVAPINVSTVEVELVTGSKRTIVVEYPSYSSIGISSSGGSYALVTTYRCGPKGIILCGMTLKNGTVAAEIISTKQVPFSQKVVDGWR